MSSSSKKKLTLNSVSVNLGCGTCRKPKLKLVSLLFRSKTKHNKKNPTYQKQKLHPRSSSSTSTSTSTTNTSFSPCYKLSCESENSPFKGFGTEGVAVEKDSDDPYLDFRHSMLQMILENEIYSKDGLRELLNCFLQLNSPQHHGVIVRAFTDIWNGVFSVRSASSTGFHLNRKPRDF